MKSKIVLTADAEFHDEELREVVNKLNTRIETINERTKNIMAYIRDIERKVTKVLNSDKT